MQCDPNGVFTGIGRLDAVTGARGDRNPIARLHRNFAHRTRSGVLEAEPCRPPQQGDPFVLGLIVPEAVGRGVAPRDEPHDAEPTAAFGQDFDKFLGQHGWDLAEQIPGIFHERCGSGFDRNVEEKRVDGKL